MASTPPDNLEQQLRDYAQQRRDAAGTPTLHPATRRVLQAEVKAQFGSTAAASESRGGWLRFWPRMAFALSLAVIVGVAIVLLPPNRKQDGQFSLAKLDESERVPASSAIPSTDKAKDVRAPAPASGPAEPALALKAFSTASSTSSATLAVASDAAARSDRDFARTENATAFKSGPARPMGKAAGAPTTAFEMDSRREVNDEGVLAGTAGQMAVQSPTLTITPTTQPPATARIMSKAAAPAAAKDGVAARSELAKKEGAFGDRQAEPLKSKGQEEFQAGVTQRYRNVVTPANQPQRRTATVPVLEEFTVAQNGSNLTIVDRDGSVYNGYARLVPADRQGGERRARYSEVEASGAIQLAPNSSGGGRAANTFNESQTRLADANRAQLDASNVSQAFNVQSAQNAWNAPAQNTLEPLNYTIRVEGTNRSLNQRVVLTGNLIQNNFVMFNNSIGGQATGNLNFQQQVVSTGNQAVYNFNNAQQVPAANNFINGQLQLGNKKPDEFNALSVDP